MSRNFKRQRNRAFLMAILIGWSYFIMLATAISKIFSGFVMQLIFLGEYFRNPAGNIFQLILNSSFITNITGGLILLALLFWGIKGLIKSLTLLLKTRKYLSSLRVIKKTKEFIVFESDQPHAFTTGLLKPMVYVSSQIYKKLKRDRSKAIIFHELGHQKNFDPLKDFVVKTFMWSIPNFPGKTKFLKEYSVLVELNCDFYAEKRLLTKRPIIEALADAIRGKISFAPENLLMGSFLNSTDRIKVLTENRQFKVKNLYFPAYILFGFIFLNTLFINQTNIFLKCHCLTECIRVFFNKESRITPENHQECKFSVREPVKSCFKIDS